MSSATPDGVATDSVAGGYVSAAQMTCTLRVATPAGVTGRFTGAGVLAGGQRTGAGLRAGFVGAGVLRAKLTPFARIAGGFTGAARLWLGMARRPARFNTACVVQQPGLPAFALVGRVDANQVSVIDLLSGGGTVYGMRYVTRPMQTNLPYHMRGTIGEQEPRAARKRVPRVKVYGEGQLATGSTLTLHVDGKSETYACGGQDITTGILIQQGFTPNMIGRVFWLELNLNGVGVTVRDIEMDYVFVG